MGLVEIETGLVNSYKKCKKKCYNVSTNTVFYCRNLGYKNLQNY